MFLVDKQIASSTRAEFFKRDACQVRPMVRCPSVPLDYLYVYSSKYRTSLLSLVLPSPHTLSCLRVFAPALQPGLIDTLSVFEPLFAELRQPRCFYTCDGLARTFRVSTKA